jgi:hypothetical protein
MLRGLTYSVRFLLGTCILTNVLGLAGRPNCAPSLRLSKLDPA